MNMNQPRIPYLTGFNAIAHLYDYAVEFHSIYEEDKALRCAIDNNGSLKRHNFDGSDGFIVRYSTSTRFDERAFYDAAKSERDTVKVERDALTTLIATRFPDSWESMLKASQLVAAKIGTPEFRLVLEWYPIPNKLEVLAFYDAAVEAQKDA